PMHAARASDKAHTWLRQSKTCMFGGDDNVAGQRDLEASPNGETIDRRDNGLVTLEVAGDPSKWYALLRQLLSPGRRRCGCFEIIARRECSVARSRYDRDPGVIILLEVVENLAQLDVGRVMQGIQHFRTI